MNQSRIKKIRKAARKLSQVPQLTFDQQVRVYQGAIRTMKKARQRNWISANIPKESKPISSKMHAGESLSDFRKKKNNL